MPNDARNDSTDYLKALPQIAEDIAVFLRCSQNIVWWTNQVDGDERRKNYTALAADVDAQVARLDKLQYGKGELARTVKSAADACRSSLRDASVSLRGDVAETALHYFGKLHSEREVLRLALYAVKASEPMRGRDGIPLSQNVVQAGGVPGYSAPTHVPTGTQSGPVVDAFEPCHQYRVDDDDANPEDKAHSPRIEVSQKANTQAPSESERQPDTTPIERTHTPETGEPREDASLNIDFPNPSAPLSKKEAASAWGGAMTVKKLTQLMGTGRVKYEQLSRERFIFCRDDIPNLPDS